jgi:hypothetical protein
MLLQDMLAAFTSFLLISSPAYGVVDESAKSALAVRQELVHEIEDHEFLFWFTPTTNFKTYDDNAGVLYFCYYAEKLDLTLHFVLGTKEGCSVDKNIYDVFFYPAQAAAGMNIPLMSSLVTAPLGRFIMVILHEDFHEQVLGIPTLALNESSATLMGLLLTREFAYQKYGAQSEPAKDAISDMTLFLRIALIEEQYASRLRGVYQQVARGEVARDEGLRLKEALFNEMKNECQGIAPKLLFTCANADNNAHFGYQLNYTAHYPLFYRLYEACGQDVMIFVTTFISLVREHLSEEQFILRVQKIIDTKRT